MVRCRLNPQTFLNLWQPGFTLSLFEYIETIPTLWDAVKGDWDVCFMLTCLIEAEKCRVYETEPRLDAKRQCLRVRLG